MKDLLDSPETLASPEGRAALATALEAAGRTQEALLCRRLGRPIVVRRGRLFPAPTPDEIAGFVADTRAWLGHDAGAARTFVRVRGWRIRTRYDHTTLTAWWSIHNERGNLSGDDAPVPDGEPAWPADAYDAAIAAVMPQVDEMMS